MHEPLWPGSSLSRPFLLCSLFGLHFFLSSPYAFGHVGETLKWKLYFQVIFLLFFFFLFFRPSVQFYSNNSRLCIEGMHMNRHIERLKWHKVKIPVALRH